MWDIVPRPGIEPAPPALEAQSLNHWTPKGSPTFSIFDTILKDIFKKLIWDFTGGAVVKNPPANAGDTGSVPGP